MKWVTGVALAGLAVAFSAPASAQQQRGFSGMQFVDAVRSGDNGKALELLESTPSVIDARDGRGETALYAAVSGRDTPWVGHLLRAGAKPDLGTRGGDTPLMAAARIGYLDAAELLIDRGAKVDAANRMGETALIIAVQARSVPLVRLLLEEGADPDRTDSAAGLSARDYAKRDTRSRDILRLIETRKPATAPSGS